ncbi:MAG TPA: VOC family protein [Symbiobacteriaceae bacterium]|nr:VOC family protein [Symbiobacteriaceae bacterium]
MPKVVHFEIPIQDPKRAIPFYEKVFGWKIEGWGGGDGYWLCTAGPDEEPGINGALMLGTPIDGGTINTLGVPSIAEYRAKVTEHGGKVVGEIQTIPGVGLFCYCMDTEGNKFGIIEMVQGA